MTPPEYDPIEWKRSLDREISSWFSDEPVEPPPVVEPPPAEGRPFPNLGMVPKPPFVSRADRQERARLLADMEANRAAAVAADTALRTEGTFPAAPPPAKEEPPATADSKPPAVSPESSNPPTPTTTTTSSPSPTGESAPSTAEALSSSRALAALPTPPAPVPLLTTSEQHGVVTFGRDTQSLGGAAERTLQDAAAFAIAKSGRVRLVAAQFSRAPVVPQQSQARTQAMVQALTRAGLPASRVSIADQITQRVDVYDVYVDY